MTTVIKTKSHRHVFLRRFSSYRSQTSLKCYRLNTTIHHWTNSFRNNRNRSMNGKQAHSQCFSNCSHRIRVESMNFSIDACTVVRRPALKQEQLSTNEKRLKRSRGRGVRCGRSASYREGDWLPRANLPYDSFQWGKVTCYAEVTTFISVFSDRRFPFMHFQWRKFADLFASCLRVVNYIIQVP